MSTPAPVIFSVGFTVSSGLASRSAAAVACDHGIISELLLQCGRGDLPSLAALVDVFYLPLRAEAATRMPAPAVEPAVERAMVAVWQDAPTYEPGQVLTAVEWIMARGTRACLAAQPPTELPDAGPSRADGMQPPQ